MSKLCPKPDAYATVQVSIRQPNGDLEAFYIPRAVAEYIHYLRSVQDNITYQLEKDWWDED
jgi:hypothetical protein